ncbi:MAG: S-layer homology domain-containing protein, partial [Defluviitaleaceae bacterium]|nr:S-layer homology domain-containing protein [Defluviitaleaceae bacterium]
GNNVGGGNNNQGGGGNNAGGGNNNNNNNAGGGNNNVPTFPSHPGGSNNDGRPTPTGPVVAGRPVIREIDLLTPDTPPITEIITAALNRLGFIQGFIDGTFRPENGLTRAEMAQIMFNLSNNPNRHGQSFFGFSDVNAGAWYFEAVSYFANAGILIGFGDDTFRPNDYITMAQFGQFMNGVFGLTARNLQSPVANRLGHWSNSVTAAAFDGSFTSYAAENFFFSEDVAITRAWAVTLINQYLGHTPVVADIEAHLAANSIDRIFSDVARGHWAFYQVFLASSEA